MFDKSQVQVYSDSNGLEITVKWFSPKAIFIAAFAVFWNAFLVFWYAIAFSVDGSLIMKLFPILHVAVGLWLIYSSLCSFLNKTFLDIKEGYLTVTHGPIPWWKGNLDIRVDDLEQLYVNQIERNSKNGKSYDYVLRAKKKDGLGLEILNIPEMTSVELQEIETYIEHYLGIEDSPVKGEYGANKSQLPTQNIEKTLDLIKFPEKEIDYRTREFDDRDFV